MNKKEKDRQSLNKNRKVLSAKAQDEEMCGIITKTTMGVIFFIQNSQILTLSLPTEEIYSGTRPKSASDKSSSCQFSSQPRKMPLPKQLSVFLFVFWFSSPSRKVWTSLSLSDTGFSVFTSHNPRKFRQMTMDWEWLRLCRFHFP